jgi:hypothetical protein
MKNFVVRKDLQMKFFLEFAAVFDWSQLNPESQMLVKCGIKIHEDVVSLTR